MFLLTWPVAQKGILDQHSWFPANFRTTSLTSLQTAVSVGKHWEFGWSQLDEFWIMRFQPDPSSSFNITLPRNYSVSKNTPIKPWPDLNQPFSMVTMIVTVWPLVTFHVSTWLSVDTDDMEIFCDQFIEQIWTDWLKMPKEATCFWLHTWHSLHGLGMRKVSARGLHKLGCPANRGKR